MQWPHQGAKNCRAEERDVGMERGKASEADAGASWGLRSGLVAAHRNFGSQDATKAQEAKSLNKTWLLKNLR